MDSGILFISIMIVGIISIMILLYLWLLLRELYLSTRSRRIVFEYESKFALIKRRKGNNECQNEPSLNHYPSS